MDDMGWFILVEQFTRLFWIPGPPPPTHNAISSAQSGEGKCVRPTHLRSPSLELAKTQVSSGLLLKRELGGSELITCSMALPTRPVPPVTRMTVDIVVDGVVEHDGTDEGLVEIFGA